MRRRIIIGCALAALMLTTAPATAKTPAPQAGYSPLSPASVGVTLLDIIVCGKGYTSHELYDMKITLLEVVRGEEAWKRIEAASMSNEPPKVGFEYILARIRFEYFARGTPGDCSHQLKEEQFTAVSADGKVYKTPSIMSPNPRLSGTLHSGDSLEGWVTFLVAKDDNKPLMTFSRDEGIWFQLH